MNEERGGVYVASFTDRDIHHFPVSTTVPSWYQVILPSTQSAFCSFSVTEGETDPCVPVTDGVGLHLGQTTLVLKVLDSQSSRPGVIAAQTSQSHDC